MGRVRIIGGMAGGRLLSSPKGFTVRPTPDLVRQAVFNSLGPVLEGAHVLDLFSGTGALGLECLSRGAGRVLSVEMSSRHARYIRDNVVALGLPAERHELRVQEALAAVRQLACTEQRFDFILADPPFGEKTARDRSRSLSQQLLDLEETRRLLRPGGWLVLGHARRDRVTVPSAWIERKCLEHGDSTFRIVRVAKAAEGEPTIGTMPEVAMGEPDSNAGQAVGSGAGEPGLAGGGGVGSA